MVHSRVKLIHTKEDTIRKQKIIRSHNKPQAKSGEYSRELTQKNRQRKCEVCDRSLPEVRPR